MKLKTKIVSLLLVSIILLFLSVKTLILIEYIESTFYTRIFEMSCILSFIPLFYCLLNSLVFLD